MRTRAFAGFVVVTAMLLAGSPAQAFDYDTHYLWTYYLALQVGYSPRQAYQIASATFAVDHDPDTGPLEASAFEALHNAPLPATETVWTRFHAFADARHASLAEWNPNDAKELVARIEAELERTGRAFTSLSVREMEDVRLYALRGDADLVKEFREKNRRDLWALALDNGNPGPYLHFLQDVYAHGDYDSRHGHLYASHLPDYLSYNVGRSREMTAETIRALQDFGLEKGFPIRVVDMDRVWRVLDELVAANPVSRLAGVRFYDALLQKAVDTVGHAGVTAVGLLEVILPFVPPGSSRILDNTLAIVPSVSSIGSPDGEAARRIVNRAIAADRQANRLPMFSAAEEQELPAEFIRYDFDAAGRVATASFPVEWPEIVLGEASLECAPDGPQQQIRVRVRVPYDIRGAAALPFQHPLPVEYTTALSVSEARQVGLARRENGRYELVHDYYPPEAWLNGSATWTGTVSVGPANQRAVAEGPLRCGRQPTAAVPPRITSPPTATIGCPVSPSLGPGTWAKSDVSGTVLNGVCPNGGCILACRWGGAYPAPFRWAEIQWQQREYSRTACIGRSPGTPSVSRSLRPQAEARDPEGKALLDALEAAVAPYAWTCPDPGSAPAAVARTSWLRPATTPAARRNLTAPADRRSVLEILAAGMAEGNTSAAEPGSANATRTLNLAGAEVTPPAGVTSTVRMAFGGRIVEATYRQEADSRGVAIDTYYYPTPPGPDGQPPGEAQRWSRLVRVPSARVNSAEAVVWWHVYWEYGAQGWSQVQNRGVSPPLGSP